MKTKQEQFIVDNSGKRKGVILDITTYQKILELLEDLEDVRYIRKHKNDPEISLEELITKLKEEKLV